MLQQSIINLSIHRHQCHKFRSQLRRFYHLSLSFFSAAITTFSNTSARHTHETSALTHNFFHIYNFTHLLILTTLLRNKNSITLQQNIVTIIHLHILCICIVYNYFHVV